MNRQPHTDETTALPPAGLPVPGKRRRCPP